MWVGQWVRGAWSAWESEGLTSISGWFRCSSPGDHTSGNMEFSCRYEHTHSVLLWVRRAQWRGRRARMIGGRCHWSLDSSLSPWLSAASDSVWLWWWLSPYPFPCHDLFSERDLISAICTDLYPDVCISNPVSYCGMKGTAHFLKRSQLSGRIGIVFFFQFLISWRQLSSPPCTQFKVTQKERKIMWLPTPGMTPYYPWSHTRSWLQREHWKTEIGYYVHAYLYGITKESGI